MTADEYFAGHGDPSYDVRHYDLALEYKLEGNQLSAKARIDAIAIESLTEVSLDLEGLSATKVTIPGTGVAKFAQRRGKLVIVPKASIHAGQEFSVLIGYGGRPQPVRHEAGEAGWEELADGVIVAGQPSGAPSWFPCNDRPDNKATYRISVTAAAAYHVVANGTLEERSQQASTATWVYSENAPMASYLATVQIGRYVLTSLAESSVKLWSVAPKSLEPGPDSAFGRQHEMMDLFVRLFGPYPFADYTVVITEDELEIPLEAQGLSVFGSNFVDNDWENVRLVAHELAHQWFGNSLTLGEWRDIWLHEGFACYAEWLWAEESGATTAHQAAVEHLNGLRSLPQDVLIGAPGPDLMFDDRVYKRGALTLHAIRLTVGDERFFAMLRAWVKDNSHGTVTTPQLIAFASSSTGHDLADLFQGWLFTETLPDLPNVD